MKGIVLVPALVLAALAVAALDEDAGVLRWWHLRQELAEAQVRIAALDREVERLREEAARLETDEFAIEKAIREELGLSRPGQTLLRLPRDGASSDRIP